LLKISAKATGSFCLAIPMPFISLPYGRSGRRPLDDGSLDDILKRLIIPTYWDAKARSGIVEHILVENGLNGAETMFVDDAMVNVEGAERPG
jgi:hypothetical protein